MKRRQVFEGATHFGILPKLDMLSNEIVFPNCILYKSKFKEDKVELFLKDLDNTNIIVSTPTLIKNMPNKLFEHLINNSSFAVEYPGLTLAVIETSYK